MTESKTGEGQTQDFTVLLEIAPEDKQERNPLVVGEVGRAIVSELRQEGYRVEPVYTGQKGIAELLFTVWTAAQSGAVQVWMHADTIASLCAIFETIKPLLIRLFKLQEKHTIKISVMIDGDLISVEADDLKEVEAALVLAKRFHSAHPDVQVTPKSQVKAQARVSKKH